MGPTRTGPRLARWRTAQECEVLAHVVEVVFALVDALCPRPKNGHRRGTVHSEGELTFELEIVERLEGLDKESRRPVELARDLFGPVARVEAEFDPLISVDRGARPIVDDARRDDPFTYRDEYVSQVRDVLEDRPSLGGRSRAHQGTGVEDQRGEGRNRVGEPGNYLLGTEVVPRESTGVAGERERQDRPTRNGHSRPCWDRGSTLQSAGRRGTPRVRRDELARA